MNKSKSLLAVMFALYFGSAAQAQYAAPYAQPEPLYPYVAQPQYVPQPYPYVQSPNVRHVPREYQSPPARPPVRVRVKTDHALVEELRKPRRKHDSARDKKKDVVVIDKKKEVEIDKKIVVREKPVVRKRIRVVDDPPIIVQREINEHGQVVSEGRVPHPGAGRVIHAEAEVTILGPDRMSIRLYRKSDGRDANAKAAPTKLKKTKTSKRDKAEPET